MEILDINTLFGAYLWCTNESMPESLVASLAKQGIKRAMIALDGWCLLSLT